MKRGSVARLRQALKALRGVGLCSLRVCGQVRLSVLLLSESLFLMYYSSLLAAIPQNKNIKR